MKTILSSLIFVYLIVHVTCKTNYPAVQEELDENIKLWDSQMVVSYEATVERSCFCTPDYLGPFSITVEGDEIVTCDYDQQICNNLLTVEDLFDGIQKAINEKYVTITVKYDKTLGYPTYFYYDIDSRMADEELGITYTIDDYEVGEADVCDLPMEVGLCKAAFLRYYYDKNTDTCKQFTYGGCGGNENNFETIKECEAACKITDIDICELPSETGPCEALIPRYFYNKKTGQCEEFTYGGCEGNENNFETKEECEVACINGDNGGDDDCFCIALFDPVCGFDGKTYGNACEAACANVKVKCENECPCNNGKDEDCDIYNCLVDPCQGATCPRYPLAKCVSNYCGGCFADFYLGDYKISDCSKDDVFDFSCTKEGQMCEFGGNTGTHGRHGGIFDHNFNKPCCEGLTCCPKTCSNKLSTKTCQKICMC